VNTGIVWPSVTATSQLQPFAAEQVSLVDGFWAARARINREHTIPHGFEQLRSQGTLNNLSLAAGAEGRYQARADTSGSTFPFLDSDVYKWLEAVGWELGRAADPDLAAAADEAIALVARAQRPDGYLNSYVQVVGGGQEHLDLAWGHEFYCIGHLIQAAVAWHRALGDDRLLSIAVGAADRIDREFGDTGRPGVDGHPGIEMALVELTRVTGDRRYLALATRMLDLRGHGLLGDGRFGAAYWQDHQPVRTATTVAGHAVRQLYLDCGAVDVAVESGDGELLAAVERRWRDLVQTRTYLTGGMGSRHRDEAFGDPFELPPDRAYAETCASIAGVMLAWRLLLATGKERYADAIERTMFNGVLSGISLTGTRFFYINPLQRRTRRAEEPPGHGTRASWFPCACCPPNLMRLLSSWPQYLATSSSAGIQIHQYAGAEFQAELAGGPVRLSLQTDYPWDGRVTVRILETPDHPWALTLRVPGWCRSATLSVPGAAPRAVPTSTDGSSAVELRRWQAGDSVVLDLDLPVRIIEPDPRIDAVRGCIAVERGPLVYCIESADLPPRAQIEDLTWDPSRPPVPVLRSEIGESVWGITLPVLQREPVADSTLNGAVSPDTGSIDPSSDGTGPARASTAAVTAGAIPYFAWGNRGAEAMRVWIPR
jgi:uncharacterized protein